jgi:hypothetical protein
VNENYNSSIENDDFENGKCISKSNFNCESFKLYIECIYSNNQINENFHCFWDITDADENEKGKCKRNLFSNGGNCSNSNHYEIIESNCRLKSCSSRVGNDSESIPCGSENCYKDLNNENRCTEVCKNGDHYEGKSN